MRQYRKHGQSSASNIWASVGRYGHTKVFLARILEGIMFLIQVWCLGQDLCTGDAHNPTSCRVYCLVATTNRPVYQVSRNFTEYRTNRLRRSECNLASSARPRVYCFMAWQPLKITTPKTPKERRFCPFFPESVEDEQHFLVTWPVYQTPRNSMLEVFLNENPHFSQITPQQKFLKLMTPDNAQLAAKTVHNLFETRSFLINKPKRTTWSTLIMHGFVWIGIAYFYLYYCYCV